MATILVQGGTYTGGTATLVTSANWSNHGESDTTSNYQPNNEGYYYIAAGSGANYATWNFTSLVGGSSYQLAITWSEYSNRGSNVPWQILDSNGSSVLASGTVNQKVATSPDYTANDSNGDVAVRFQKIGTSVVPTGSSLTVKVTDNANGYIIVNAAYLLLISSPVGSSFRGASILRPFDRPIRGPAVTVIYG